MATVTRSLPTAADALELLEEVSEGLADRTVKRADLKRELDQARTRLDELAEASPLFEMNMPGEDIVAALHMLHEQAHGPISFRFCAAEPCHSLELPPTDTQGPAPRVLPNGTLS